MALETYTVRKVKNRLGKLFEEGALTFHLRPALEVNSDGVVGCSGHIVNNETGRVIYINTEASCYGVLSDKVLYRVAKDIKDYTGGQNQWAPNANFIPELAVALTK